MRITTPPSDTNVPGGWAVAACAEEIRAAKRIKKTANTPNALDALKFFVLMTSLSDKFTHRTLLPRQYTLLAR
jgi:hypothetical protein